MFFVLVFDDLSIFPAVLKPNLQPTIDFKCEAKKLSQRVLVLCTRLNDLGRKSPPL